MKYVENRDNEQLSEEYGQSMYYAVIEYPDDVNIKPFILLPCGTKLHAESAAKCYDKLGGLPYGLWGNAHYEAHPVPEYLQHGDDFYELPLPLKN
jgi:hypothetical protein